MANPDRRLGLIGALSLAGLGVAAGGGVLYDSAGEVGRLQDEQRRNANATSIGTNKLYNQQLENRLTESLWFTAGGGVALALSVGTAIGAGAVIYSGRRRPELHNADLVEPQQKG